MRDSLRKVKKNKHFKLGYGYKLFLLDILPKNSVGAEIGVYLGNFAKYIVNIVKPSQLILIDPWINKRHFSTFLQTYMHYMMKTDTKVTIIMKTVEDAYKKNRIVDNYFDWVYLDADHELESTRRQLKICQKIVKPGGIISGDDYDAKHWPHVVTAVDEFVKGNGMILRTKNYQYWMKNE